MAPELGSDIVSDTESEYSARDDPDAYDFDSEHYGLSEADRRVKIILRDAHDTKGKGMTFEMPYLRDFKNIFDHFKQRSCANCRCTEEMRFKTSTRAVEETDTPKKLDLIHGATTEIKVWSNGPGLHCQACKRSGYPKTDGVDTALYRKAVFIPWTRRNQQGKTITLIVADQTGFETSVKMLNTVSFKYLMEQYAETALRDLDICRFLFDGERLLKNETPKRAGMVDNDRIEVFIQQTGGYAMTAEAAITNQMH